VENKSGFTLVETLVVVAIIGLLAAISIPLTLNSINRAKQARTMADIRAIGSAWETRATEVKSYNAAGARYSLPTTTLTAANFTRMLAPTYMRTIPTRDGWSGTLEFFTDSPIGNKTQATTYAIRSRGRNGIQDRARTYTIGATTNFDCDIIFSHGGFLVYPEGKQNH
jgi:type II secretion system protein G